MDATPEVQNDQEIHAQNADLRFWWNDVRGRPRGDDGVHHVGLLDKTDGAHLYSSRSMSQLIVHDNFCCHLTFIAVFCILVLRKKDNISLDAEDFLAWIRQQRIQLLSVSIITILICNQIAISGSFQAFGGSLRKRVDGAALVRTPRRVHSSLSARTLIADGEPASSKISTSPQAEWPALTRQCREVRGEDWCAFFVCVFNS